MRFIKTWEPIPLVLLRRDRSGFGRSFFAKKRGGITLRAEPINESNLYLFHEGTQTQAYSILGAHPTEQNGQRGTRFSVWAPHAENIWVEGDFNNWCGNGFRMERVGDSGVWSLFAPGVEPNSLYKYAIQHPSGEIRVKADPFAFAAELRPSTASRIVSADHLLD